MKGQVQGNQVWLTRVEGKGCDVGKSSCPLASVRAGCDRAPREPEWDETCDADRDGHSWLQQHGWVICNGRNERLVASTRVERRGEMSGLRFNGVSLAGASEDDYIHVRYERGD